MGWIPMDTTWWAGVVDALLATAAAWPEGAQLTDLRWWEDQVRMGRALAPSRRALAARWRVSERRVRDLLASLAWRDARTADALGDAPFCADAAAGAHGPRLAQRRPSEGPAARREGAPARVDTAVSGPRLAQRWPSRGPGALHDQPGTGLSEAPHTAHSTDHTALLTERSAPPGAGEPVQVSLPLRPRARLATEGDAPRVEPPSRPRRRPVPLSAEAREVWQELQVEARQHDPGWRDVAVEPHAATLLGALRLAREAGAPQGMAAAEVLRTAWRWWWTGPDTYWRARRTGADALLTMLRPSTLTTHGLLDRALDWRARARPAKAAQPTRATAPRPAQEAPAPAGGPDTWASLDGAAQAHARATAEAMLAPLRGCTPAREWAELVELQARALAGRGAYPPPPVWSPPQEPGPQKMSSAARDPLQKTGFQADRSHVVAA
jgi:hypothetical protein